MMISCNRWILFAVSVLVGGNGCVSRVSSGNYKDDTSLKTLKDGFVQPPDSVRPYVYWYWVNDNISPSGVVKDLKSMKDVGIGGAFIGNIGLTKEEGTPYGDVKLFSDTWWQAIDSAMRYATEQQITLGMFNSPGWSQSGGPWVKPSESMQFLSGEEIVVSGPAKLNMPLKEMPESFRDVALIAYPSHREKADFQALQPIVTASKNIPDLNALVDDNIETFSTIPVAPNEQVFIDIQLNKNCPARSLLIHPYKRGFSTHGELQAFIGGTFQTVEKFVLDRSNHRLNVGFIPDAPFAISFPLIVADRFRLVFTNATQPVVLADIRISEIPMLEQYMEKQLAKMYPTPLPLWKEYQWPQADSTVSLKGTVAYNAVKNISSHLTGDGRLIWDVPAGEWIITRYGMQPTGVKNSPASPEGVGLEIDKMNKNVLVPHFDSFIGKVLKRIPPEKRTTLKYVVADSYEVGSQNWTDGMSAHFVKKYQYDPIPFLPVLNGTIINTEDESDRFLWDLRRLVADLVADEYVGGLRELSNKNGLKLWLENYGHWGFPSEFLKYGGQSDEVSGEFWNEGELGNIENRAASSAAHIYGKKRVWSESFTAGGGTYARYPAMLRKRGDWSFTEGVNQTLFHLYIHQPYEDWKPGVNAWFSTEFNRKNTWFPYSKEYVDYIRRCNFMLQQGNPVNDIAYFIGEDAPKMTGVRDPEIPVGYSYDYINAEVILDRLAVKDGRFVLPHGMSYAMIVLPKLTTMTPELLAKIKDLTEQGGIILGPPPSRSPSLKGFPDSDQKVKKMAAELWGGEELTPGIRSFGKGRVMNGISLQQALDYLNISPDFSSEANNEVLFAHRRMNNTDIYFITNQSDKPLSFNAAFRVKNKRAGWWNAVTGELRSLPEYKHHNNLTSMPIKLGINESGFVVFDNDIQSYGLSTGTANFPTYTINQTLRSPWKVKFDILSGGPEKAVIMDTLKAWNEMNDKQVRNYSGVAVYETNFVHNGEKGTEPLFLDLGSVQVMASIKINGQSAGTLWTAPWRVDITKLVKKGDNKLEVEVINTWANRLIGDQALPVKDKKSWSSYNLYKADDPLMAAGLLGPVTIQSVGN